MREIIALFIRNGGFITFLLLEALCFFLLVNFNDHQAGIYSYSSSIVAGNVLNKRRAMSQYLTAVNEMDSLQQVVANLRTELASRQYIKVPYRDTFLIRPLDSIQNAKSGTYFNFIAGQVVSNSVANRDNWFVINVGFKDGVKDGMGVVLMDGVMGVVRHCSKDFSICMSILHQQSKISARLKEQKVLGSLRYPGDDPQHMLLEDIPKHVQIKKGDDVVTSGYSTIFPKDISLGKVDSIFLPRGSNFYALHVRLNQDLSKADYVYVVENFNRIQLDSLMNKVK